MRQNTLSLQKRAQGCLVGQAIGDALGAPVEGFKPSAIRQRYGWIDDFLQDQPVGTDDTEYAVLNALILLEYGLDLTPSEVHAAWRRWLMAPESGFRGGGFSDVIAMNNLRTGLAPPASGRFNQQMWSDGLAMAVGPVGVACAGEPAQAAHVASQLGSISNGRDGIHAGQAVSAAIALAMTGATPRQMLACALDHAPATSWTHRMLQRAATLASPAADPRTAVDLLHEGLAVAFYPWTDIAPEAVALAFGALLAAQGDYRLSVEIGVNLGRDADTIGAIAGALAGAHQGIDAVPAAWQERIVGVPGRNFRVVAGIRLVELADRLVARFLGEGV